MVWQAISPHMYNLRSILRSSLKDKNYISRIPIFGHAPKLCELMLGTLSFRGLMTPVQWVSLTVKKLSSRTDECVLKHG